MHRTSAVVVVLVILLVACGFLTFLFWQSNQRALAAELKAIEAEQKVRFAQSTMERPAFLWAAYEAQKALAQAPNSKTARQAPYVHAVIFYVKTDAPAGEVDALIADAHNKLAKISTVRQLWAGKPADKATPNLAVKDYHAGLLCIFDDYDGLQKYIDDPLHQEYVKTHQKHLEKVLVYDFANPK